MPGQSVLVTSPTGRVRKVRKRRKVFSLTSWEEEQMPSISATVIHQFQSRSLKKLSVHSVHSAVPCSHKAAQLREPYRALPKEQLSSTRANGGATAKVRPFYTATVLPSYLEALMPMRLS